MKEQNFVISEKKRGNEGGGGGDKIIRDEMKRKNTYSTRSEQRAKMNYSIDGTENAHFFRRITGKWDKKESARKTEREKERGRGTRNETDKTHSNYRTFTVNS